MVYGYMSSRMFCGSQCAARQDPVLAEKLGIDSTVVAPTTGAQSCTRRWLSARL